MKNTLTLKKIYRMISIRWQLIVILISGWLVKESITSSAAAACETTDGTGCKLATRLFICLYKIEWTHAVTSLDSSVTIYGPNRCRMQVLPWI